MAGRMEMLAAGNLGDLHAEVGKKSLCVLCDFRTVALSEHFSSYNLGNDRAFLTKVTKNMFGHYLATYIM